MATPALQTVNQAPVEPLLRLKDGAKLPNKKLSDALKAKFQHYQNKDATTWRSLISIGSQVELFFQGQQFPVQNPFDGSWTALPMGAMQNSNAQQRALNVMQSYASNLESKWSGSNPDILVRPGRNIDQCMIAAKGGQVVWDYYARRFYTPWYNRQECRAGITFGTYLNRIRFDESVQSFSTLNDVFETKNVQMGEGFGFCPDCQFAGPANLFEQNPDAHEAFGGQVGICPECRGMAQVSAPPSQEMQSVSGQEEKQHGDLVCEQLPLAAVRFDLMRRAEESSWFIYRQETTRGAITAHLGNIKIPGEPGTTGQDIDGLSVVRNLAYSGQALAGYGFGYGNWSEYKDKDERVSFDEMWLGPDEISDIEIEKEEETVSGEKIPKGRLVDHFPSGLCCVGLNGMAVILGLYEEKHQQHISSGVWYVKGLSGAGRGLVDTVEVQKQMNQFANQSANYFDSIATPAVGVDTQILPPGRARYLGSPRLNIPFDLTKLPDGRTLKDSIWQFQAAPIPSAMIQYYQQFLSVIGQKTSGVTDFNNGEPGITSQNTTATAAEIDQSNADAINQPIFQGKAQLRKNNAELVLKLYPKHFPMKRFLHISGKFGEQEGIELYGSDVDADLICEVVVNSEMPKGPFTQRKNMMALFQVTGGGEGYSMLKQTDPKLAANLVQVFDVDIDSDDYEDVADICRQRMDQMKAASKVGVDDPFALVFAIDPPISDVEPNLAQKAKWFSDILDVDETQHVPLSLRQACEFLARGLTLGAIQEQAMLALGQGAVATAGEVAPALGQQMMQPEQEPQVDPNQQAKMEMDAQGQAVQSEEAERSRLHEATEAEKQRLHDEKMKDAEHKNKLAVIKAKPTVKGKAK